MLTARNAVQVEVEYAADEDFGPHHQERLLALSGLVHSMAEQPGQWDNAVELCRSLVAAQTRWLGAAHADTLRSKMDLGTLLSSWPCDDGMDRDKSESKPVLQHA